MKKNVVRALLFVVLFDIIGFLILMLGAIVLPGENIGQIELLVAAGLALPLAWFLSARVMDGLKR